MQEAVHILPIHGCEGSGQMIKIFRGGAVQCPLYDPRGVIFWRLYFELIDGFPAAKALLGNEFCLTNKYIGARLFQLDNVQLFKTQI